MDQMRWQQPRVVAVMGNPNTGKSSLFNALTGLRQKVANYPGVTVERHTGEIQLPEGPVTLVDVPGTYSLAANSPDEMVAVDVLTGHFSDVGQPEAILVVVDASNLRRNLYLVTQLLEISLPVVVALNMMDVAAKRGITIDIAGLSAALQAPVVPLVATKREGLEALRQALSQTLATPVMPAILRVPEITQAAQNLADQLGLQGRLAAYTVERALIDAGGHAESRLLKQYPNMITAANLKNLRDHLGISQPLAHYEAQQRYAWIHQVIAPLETHLPPPARWTDQLEHWVSHPVWGVLLFLGVMATVFQAVFSWAAPLMDWIDAGVAASRGWLATHLPPGALTDLLTDGIIAGVGSVIIFLPQILILFTLIIILEDTGYMARAAFLMDRFMRLCGLSGQSFIPMLSSFACAVPGVMATRIIPNDRDRLVTMLVAPFMTCSARLPVYALLIAAFVPAQSYFYGLLNLQGLVLLGLYLLGITGGIITAWLLKNTLLKSNTPGFLMELPPYRWPDPKAALYRLWERAKVFLTQAGTVIFSIAILIWALAYFPRPLAIAHDFAAQRQVAETTLQGDALENQLKHLDQAQAAVYLEQSYLGQVGHIIAPLFAPLGWDWKVSAAVLASFPAREVVIAVLGTIYAVGSEVDAQDTRLITQLQSATHPDGTLVFNLPMVIGLMIFYAFCLQCIATLGVIRRESNSWRWPLFAWIYMTSLGYGGAWLVMQIF